MGRPYERGRGYNLTMTGLIYAMIALGNATLTGVMSGWLLYFYLPPGGPALVPAALFGVVMLASRALHIPLSRWMDERLRRGRKLPFLVGGAVFMPVLFGLLWTVPRGNMSTANLFILAVALIAFNVASGVQVSAYESISTELGTEKETQAAMANWRMIFLLAGNVLAGFAGPMIGRLGSATSMWIFAAFSAPFLILPGLLLRGKIDQDAQPIERPAFWEHLKGALRKPAFRIFALTWGLMWLATTFTFETLPYIATEICKLDIAGTAYLYFAAVLVGLLVYPGVMWLAEKYGARRVFRGSLLAGAITMPGLMLIGGNIPVALPVQGVVWIVLQSASLAGAQALPGALTAEMGVGDQSMAGNLIDQVASGVALAIIPLFLVLGRGQFDAQGALGVRLLGAAGGVMLLAAFVVFGKYQIEKVNTI